MTVLTVADYRERLRGRPEPFHAATPFGSTTVQFAAHSPIIGIAPHHSHHVRDELHDHLEIAEAERLYEEDPATERFLARVPHTLVPNQSRYEVDMNRSPEAAVYVTPEMAWGVRVYKGELPRRVIENTLEKWYEHHSMIDAAVESAIERFGRAIVLDVHSFNYQRDGEVDWRTDGKPVINLGTAHLDLDDEGEKLKDWFLEDLQGHTLQGEEMLVEENSVFQGGYINRRLARTYGPRCITFSVEWKKVFMDAAGQEVHEEVLSDLVQQFEGTLEALAERIDAPLRDEPVVPTVVRA